MEEYRRRDFLKIAGGVLAAAATVTLAPRMIHAASGSTVRFAWSRYTGWEPIGYMQSSGIMDRWNKKYGTNVRMEYVNDYVESINQYTAGTYDGVAVTNMDVLTNPAIGGVDSEAVVIGDFSDGNDGVGLMNGLTMTDIRGRKVRLVQLSVSHYLLARCLEKHGLSEKDVTLVNASDADILNTFRNDTDSKKAVVTWNPMLMDVRNTAGVSMVCDSSQIPGEILDMLVMRKSVSENAKKALTGAWYETISVMFGNDKRAKEAIKQMAKQAGGTLAEFEAQLKTTHMYANPADAAALARSEKLKQTMQYVRVFSFTHGLFPGARNVDVVGIEFPDSSVLGSSTNVKLRFTDTYMALAANGNL